MTKLYGETVATDPKKTDPGGWNIEGLGPSNPMLPLPHELREQFALLIVAGKSPSKAYSVVSPKAKTPAVTGRAWASRPEVIARVQYLQQEAAKMAGVNTQGVISRLLSIADKAEDAYMVEGVKALNVARQAVMDAAKVGGLIVQKVEGQIDVVAALGSMPLEQLRELALAAGAAVRQGPLSDPAIAGPQSGAIEDADYEDVTPSHTPDQSNPPAPPAGDQDDPFAP